MNIAVLETKKILKKCTFEIILKFIISVLLRGTLLIIPIIWGKAIDMVTASNFKLSYKLVLVTLGVTILYYICEGINQIVYYILYKKMYKNFSKMAYQSFVTNSISSVILMIDDIRLISFLPFCLLIQLMPCITPLCAKSVYNRPDIDGTI